MDDRLLTSASLSAALLALTALSGCPASQEEEEEPAQPLSSEDAAQAAAEQICAAVFGCDCEVSINYEDEADCIAQNTASIQAGLDQAMAEHGGVWDEACAGQLLWTWKQWECMGSTQASYEASFDFNACPLMRGELQEGEYCEDYDFAYEPCASGLRCAQETCLPAPQIPAAVGQSCEFGWETLPCASGSFCDYDYDSGARTCVATPKAGDSCDPSYTYLCGPASNNLLCNEAGTCVGAPGEGQSCEDALICAAGLYCDGGKDFTCQPRRELGQGCGADVVCPVDASCLANICVADEAAACAPTYF